MRLGYRFAPTSLPSIRVGTGRSMLMLHGYAMQPSTYLPTATLLGCRGQVIIPTLFDLPGIWTVRHALDCLDATLDQLAVEQFSLFGHSFSGGLVLGLAARHPDRVVECVFADTLGLSERFRLAGEALRHPLGLLALATPSATQAFLHSLATHPIQLTAAALCGFLDDRQKDVCRVVAERIPCHVLWAGHDTLLARSDGRAFADALDASFTVASEPVEHDWVFEQPELFVSHLDGLGLKFLGHAE